MKELEALLEKRWILKTEDKELYYKVRDSIGEIRRFATDKMGCQVIENSLLVKMEKIPAINSRGYYSKKNECFMHVDEATGDEAKWIKAYNILQYNSMFDEKDRSSLLFPYMK